MSCKNDTSVRGVLAPCAFHISPLAPCSFYFLPLLLFPLLLFLFSLLLFLFFSCSRIVNRTLPFPIIVFLAPGLLLSAPCSFFVRKISAPCSKITVFCSMLLFCLKIFCSLLQYYSFPDPCSFLSTAVHKCTVGSYVSLSVRLSGLVC